MLLTDARLRAAVKTLELSGIGIGDLAAKPSEAPTFFRPLKEELGAALKAGRPASLAAVSAAEDLAARLEKTFSDMALLGVPPDAPALEALRALQRACAAAGDLLTISKRAAADRELKALCSGARRTLAQAKAAAEGAGFPLNLKFCSIYSGLDAVFDALERCSEALFKV